MNEAMQQLVEWVKNASPILWQAAYRQVFVNGVEEILSFCFLAYFAIFGFRYAKRNWRDMDEGRALTTIGIGILCLLAAIFLTGAIDDFGNPTYQAIRNLTGLMPHVK